jgi:hypothetical protein
MLECEWVILESHLDADTVRDAEYKWVKYFLDMGCEVLNKDANCTHPGILGHSDESRQRMSNAKMGSTPWNKGKGVSARTLRRYSGVNKGLTPAQASVAARKGKQLTAEHRLKLSKFHKSRYTDPDVYNKQVEICRNIVHPSGWTMTQEHKDKIAESTRIALSAPDVRSKISAALTLAYAEGRR